MNTSELEFQKIYNAFQPKIFRYLSHLADEQEAEDLTQETFVKVHQGLENFRGESQLSTWIYRIATNAARDRMRSPSYQRMTRNCDLGNEIENNQAEIEDQNTWTREKTPLVEQQIFHKEMNECIRGYIEKLPEDYRVALVLSEYEGIKNNEIAEILGVTLDTVKIRLHRAKEKLKETLKANCDSDWIEGNEFIPELKSR